MAVSMAVIPLLKDDTAKSFMKSLEHAKLKPYTDEQRKSTDKELEEIFSKRLKK